MDYDIYYHNDFDGRASAAIMADFLQGRGDVATRFIPMSYATERTWGLWRLPRPAIVVDFLYNPRAEFWFDHHPTAFFREKWRKAFRSGKRKRWDTSYKSACHLVFDSLVRDFGYRPPRRFKELAHWLDIVDGARYTSALQAVENKEPALALNILIEQKKEDKRFQGPLIRMLRDMPLSEIVVVPSVKKELAILERRRGEIIRYYRHHTLFTRGVAYIDLTTRGRKELRFAPYHFFPKARYALAIKKNAEGHAYHISLGSNPWRKENRKHIGEFLRKHYNGGGHKDAGGAEIKSKRNIAAVVRELIDRFGTS